MLCFSEDTLLFAAMLHGSCVRGEEGVLVLLCDLVRDAICWACHRVAVHLGHLQDHPGISVDGAANRVGTQLEMSCIGETCTKIPNEKDLGRME